MKVRFYTLLGVTTPAEAAAKWPVDLIRPFVGDPGGIQDESYQDLMVHLQDSLEFRTVRPGADSDRVGLSAQVFITPSPVPTPLVMAPLSELAFLLKPTGALPAMLSVTRGAGGLEVAIQGLPVEIQFPPGMIQPIYTQAELEASDFDPPDKRLTADDAPFDPNLPDSVEVIASDSGPTRVTVRVNVRLTDTDDFLFDTVVPISIGPCKLSGLPVRGLHDIQLIPNPKPAHVESAHLAPEIALEWARRDISISDLDASTPGLITIRTVDFDSRVEPLRGLFDEIRAKRDEADPIELVLEDVVLPFRTAPPLPIPTHGRVSLRRAVVLEDAAVEMYDLQSAPIDLEVRGTVLRIFRMMLQIPPPGELPAAVDIKWSDEPDDPSSAILTMGVTVNEQGEVILGALNPAPVTFLRILGLGIQLGAVKLGVSLKKIFDGEDDDWYAIFALLGDFIILTGEQAEQTGEEAGSSPFSLRDESGQPAARIVHDLGWAFGGMSLGGFYDPSKLRFLIANTFRLEIDELGLVTENNGGLYLMLSASMLIWPGEKPAEITGPATNVTSSADDAKRKGFGLRVHRFKALIGPTTDNRPEYLVDGISLFIRKGGFELLGFGMVSSYQRPPGNKYDEIAVELKARFSLCGRSIDAGFQYLHGDVSGVDTFSYLLVGGSIGNIPLGSTRLGVAILYVRNMTPRLDPPNAQPQAMRLLRWFKANGDAITVPLDRKLGAWMPLDDADAIGGLISWTLAASNALRFEGFFFYHKSSGEEGLLIGIELYFVGSEKPILFGILEYDYTRDKFGFMAGLALSLENVLGKHLPSFLANLAGLSGTIFYGNKPDTLAIGQYNDQSTWLQFSLKFGGERLHFGIFVGFCHHRVDEPDPSSPDPLVERINVWAFTISLKGGGKIKILGSLQAYATFTLVIGQWRTEGLASGHQFLIEAGLRCKIFGCFNFGAHVKVDVAALGPGEPAYQRKSTTFRIETPWYLPDVTFRWESTAGTAVPEAMEVVVPPMSSGSARVPVGARAITPIGVTTLVGDIGQGPTYELRRLRTAAPQSPGDQDFAALTPVGVDSELMIDFGVSCDASATVVPSTLDTAGGTQQSNQLTTRYEIIEVGVRRRKRFGDGVWHDLIDPFTTNLESLEGLSASELEARFHPTVRFDWDPDLQRVGKIDPRRLLVNADTPFSFSATNPESDEVIVATGTGWPCCRPPRRPAQWHVVDFVDTPIGARTPALERFTRSQSSLRWIGDRPPVVVPPVHAPAGTPVVMLRIGPRAAGVLAVATFDEPAALCQVFTYWAATHSESQLVIEGFDGLQIVASIVLPASAASPPTPITVAAPRGMSSLHIRKAGPLEQPAFDPGPAIEIAMLRYRTPREMDALEWEKYRCGAQNDAIHGEGRLAWLPNTDYEVTVKTRIMLGYTAAGDQDGVIEQKSYFRTRGLVGLNAIARVGEEVDPYVESTYPSPGGFLYRREPLAIAFSEKFNTLVPVDRTPAPSDPEERQQLVELALAVEKIGDAQGVVDRVSATSADWIVTHRPPNPPAPVPPRGPIVLHDGVLTAGLRTARTTDPFRMRFENLVSLPTSCVATPPLHTSQVLVHQPYDPGAPDADPPRWERNREYRVNLRQKAGPFVERSTFDEADAGAFQPISESGGPVSWASDKRVMRPVGPLLSGVRQLAVFGDAVGWQHVQIRTSVDPDGAVAGLAVAVSGFSAGRAIYALVDETGATPRLRLVLRRDGVDTELGAAPIPETLTKPYVLEVISFDDRVRAQIGDAKVETPSDRGDVRSGRVALVAQGGGKFHSLGVSALDQWRCHFRSSRYDDFLAHINSFDQRLDVIEEGAAGAPTTTVAALLTRDAVRINELMTPQGDLEARERVFSEWTTALALPLRHDPASLSLTRFVAGGSTALVVIESPEPLSFSRDVTLVVRRRIVTFPHFPDAVRGGSGGVFSPRLAMRSAGRGTAGVRDRETDEMTAFLNSLELDGGQLIAPLIPASLRGLKTIVRAETTRRGTEYHVYKLPAKSRGSVTVVSGYRTMTAVDAPSSFLTIAPGEIGLFDGGGRQILPPFPLPPLQTYVTVPTRILTNGDERLALLIPIGGSFTSHTPMGNGTYRFVFSIDRPRWRSAVADDTTNYRASQTIALRW